MPDRKSAPQFRGRRRMSPSIVVGWYLVLVGALAADVRLAPFFQDHAVLQRERPLIVWGEADPAEEVSVSFGSLTASTKADANGKWKIELSRPVASVDPAELVVRGKNQITIRDLLVGDVWLCSGQSNMAWSVGAAANADAEIAAANWPMIRHLKIGLTAADVPQTQFAGRWTVCSPCTVATYSAVGYYFARDVHRSTEVPIGIINCSFGGSAIEAWLSESSLRLDSASMTVSQRWKQSVGAVTERQRSDFESALAAWRQTETRAALDPAEVRTAKPWPPPGPGSFQQPASLYNGMLSPIIPAAIRGILWYQGESNADRANEYQHLFSTLITSWRRDFGQGDIPFYWVQLPNFQTKDPARRSWAGLREAQTLTLGLPATGQAVTIDIGNPDYIHPANKQEVGRRLALIALAKNYGGTKEFLGPTFSDVVRNGTSLRIRFDHIQRQLTADEDTLKEFELAGRDDHFHPATALIEGDTVVLSSSDVSEPMRARYAWRDSPHARLYGEAGLPAGPFCTGLEDLRSVSSRRD